MPSLRSFFVISIAATLLFAARSHAVPADQKSYSRKQPNGVNMTLHLIGDEWFSWEETVDGRPVTKDPASGYYVYLKEGTNGQAVVTSNRVNIEPAPVQPWRLKGTADQQKRLADVRASVTKKTVPSSGAGRVPVLCGFFTDKNPRFSPQAISNMLFTTGAGVRSMSTYYTEVSFGKFTVKCAQGGVGGWYRAPNTRAYYGAQNGPGTNDIRPAQFVADIVNAAIAAGYDFSGCDQDGDGKVDVVNIVHAGAGQETRSNSTDNIWSHRFSLSASGLATIKASNGLIIDDYVIEPELAGADTSTNIVAPGVFCHEYGHALGLPDLYDPDYTTEGIGQWSGMSYGANNGFVFNGDCPAHFDAWCKAKLGWLAPVNYTLDSTHVSFPNAAQTAFAARLWKDGGGSSEYFLVENRYKTNFDAALPGNGLLIWHIDDSKNVGNKGNTYDWCPIAVGGAPAITNLGHKLVMLEQADGLYQFDTTNVTAQNIGDAGDPFPGTSNKRLFSSNTVPNSLAYNVGTKAGFNTWVTVGNISDAGPTMTADIYTRSPNSGPDVSWVNIAGVVPPYDGATFATLDPQHPLVVNVLPGPTGVSLSQLQLYLTRASDGRWWDWANHV
ncbi:MAG: peptidase, partial [Verrucomicrobiales bacterium]|nr:peptidase [Verrucomicrobiales bacterium]